MAELIVNVLLACIVAAAAIFLAVNWNRGGMRKKQRIMLVRILTAAALLLALQ